MSNGWTVEMSGPQQQLSGSLIILELLKIFKSLLWKEVSLKESFPYHMQPLEIWSQNLDQRRDTKRSD